MSKISLKPNASGTGVFSLEAPNSNVDRTLTLRDETGDLVTTATDLEPQVKDSLNATGTAPVYACRAWVNFNGQGTVSIRDSGNVSSITDNNTGSYTVNFTTSMPDGNFSAVSSVGDGYPSVSINATSVTINTRFDTGAFSDQSVVYCAVFR
jgi:hypothetical protein